MMSDFYRKLIHFVSLPLPSLGRSGCITTFERKSNLKLGDDRFFQNLMSSNDLEHGRSAGFTKNAEGVIRSALDSPVVVLLSLQPAL